MSRIIKRYEFVNEAPGKPHMFPNLDREGSAAGLSADGGNSDFELISDRVRYGTVKGRFEALFEEEGMSSESHQTKTELAENHAAELEEAYSRGFVEGEKTGTLSERKKIEPVFETFRGAILELGRCREALVSKFEKASVELALAIARKIVCHEVSINRETVVDVLKGTMKETGGSEIVKIRINPSDFQIVKDAGRSFPELAVENMGNATLEGDSSVPSGGCVVDTDFGSVDARIEHQFGAIEEALRENL